MANKYKIAALAKARKDGLTAEAVSALDYRGIAALCAVKVEANGNSPKDFFYVNVRRCVEGTLKAEEETAAELAMEAAVLAKLSPGEKVWVESKITKDAIADTYDIEIMEVSK